MEREGEEEEEGEEGIKWISWERTFFWKSLFLLTHSLLSSLIPSTTFFFPFHSFLSFSSLIPFPFSLLHTFYVLLDLLLYWYIKKYSESVLCCCSQIIHSLGRGRKVKNATSDQVEPVFGPMKDRNFLSQKIHFSDRRERRRRKRE